MVAQALADRYDTASALWADKMRLLGYYDAYLGFLSHWPNKPPAQTVLDVGAGTGAMAEAYVAINGAPEALTLLDPSRPMLDRASKALARRDVQPELLATGLAADVTGPQDTLLAAHVIEHFADPMTALRDMAALLKPGGTLWLIVSKPHWCNAIIWLQWRHRTYGPGAIQRLLGDAGLALEAEYAFPSGPPSRTSRGYLARRV